MAIGRTNAGGAGGAALNFKVVPGLTQPGTASENTIWVKTEGLTGWYFAATQPENMQEGEVWFPTGTESAVEFNALKKNAIQVYPLSAKQLTGGVLVDVEAMSYQGGEWVDWWDGTLYYQGNEYTEFTGGIVADSATKLTKDEVTFNIGYNGSQTGDTGVYTVEPIDITDFKTLNATIDKVNFGEYCTYHMRAFKDGNEVAALNSIETAKTISLDVSSLDGGHTFRIGVYRYISNTVCDITVSKWWLGR